MTQIVYRFGLPFVSVTLQMSDVTIMLDHVLLDTGSAGTVFRVDDLQPLGIELHPDDRVRYLTGIGGREAVIEKVMDSIRLGNLSTSLFTIQVGALDYGIPMNGILGINFLKTVGAIVDLNHSEVR